MVKKVYCDVCGKELSLFGLVPGVALDDPGVGQTLSVALNDMAYDEVHLCNEDLETFMVFWTSFRQSEEGS